MNIKKKLEEILDQAKTRLNENPNILGLPDYPSVYAYLIAKLEVLIEMIEYEDSFKEAFKDVFQEIRESTSILREIKGIVK